MFFGHNGTRNGRRVLFHQCGWRLGVHFLSVYRHASVSRAFLKFASQCRPYPVGCRYGRVPGIVGRHEWVNQWWTECNVFCITLDALHAIVVSNGDQSGTASLSLFTINISYASTTNFLCLTILGVSCDCSKTGAVGRMISLAMARGDAVKHSSNP